MVLVDKLDDMTVKAIPCMPTLVGCVMFLRALLGELARTFVKANIPDAAGNFQTIVYEYIQEHDLERQDFSNLAGILM